MIELTINGRPQTVDVEPEMPLLWVLRDVVGLTGTKFGCGVALCGACTVHVDGRPIRSCIAPVASMVGKKITTIEAIGETARALGWDMASPYSRTLGSYFPIGSVGHTGYTGTAIWMDPPTQTYMIVLTNRVHPYGKGEVAELRRRISAAVGTRFAPRGDPPVVLTPESAPTAPAADESARPDGPTVSGLDRLVAEEFAPLSGRTIGLITNQTGVDGQGRRGIDLLAAA